MIAFSERNSFVCRGLTVFYGCISVLGVSNENRFQRTYLQRHLLEGYQRMERTRNGSRLAEVLVKKAVGERGKGPSVSFFLIDNLLCEHGRVISHPRPPVSHPGVEESQRARPVRLQQRCPGGRVVSTAVLLLLSPWPWLSPWVTTNHLCAPALTPGERPVKGRPPED